MGATRHPPEARSSKRGVLAQRAARSSKRAAPPLNIRCISPHKTAPAIRGGARLSREERIVFAQYLSIDEDPRRQRPSESKLGALARKSGDLGKGQLATERLEDRHESYAPPCGFPRPLTQKPASKYQP